MPVLKVGRFDQLEVVVYATPEDLGTAAATDLAQVLGDALCQANEAAIIVASASSQDEFMAALREMGLIDWQKIAIFHMDEYVGTPASHPASFRRYVRDQLADHVQPRAFFEIGGDAGDLEAEMARYEGLLGREKPVACVLGIGENGHLAFNEPPAEFHTTQAMRVVTLADASRQQQVAEGHFESVCDVPRAALTLTVPTLLKPAHVLAVVPEGRKARAVGAALNGPVSPDCPASILRTVPNARLYLDSDSASELSSLHEPDLSRDEASPTPAHRGSMPSRVHW